MKHGRPWRMGSVKRKNRHLEMKEASQPFESSLKAADKENDLSISLFFGVRMPILCALERKKSMARGRMGC